MELRERRPHPHPELGVRGSQRLVHEKRLGWRTIARPIATRCPLPAREMGRPAFEEFIQAEQHCDLVDSLSDLRLRCPTDL
jgi:hypothetical protein